MGYVKLSELLARSPVDVPRLITERVRALGVGGVLKALGERLRGLDEVALDVLSALMVGRHVVLVGPVGVGKTTLAEAVAEILSLGDPPYVEVACHSHMTAVDLTGDIDIAVVLQAGLDHPLAYIPGPLVEAHGRILVLDEINRLNPYSQAALLQALQEHYVVVRGYRIRSDFAMIGTANPSEYEGVYELSEALADRVKFVEMDYPSADVLRAVLKWRVEEALRHIGVEVPDYVIELAAKFAENLREAGAPASIRALTYSIAGAIAKSWAKGGDISLSELKRQIRANFSRQLRRDDADEIIDRALLKAANG
jgi:MoxR-like ATPase